MKMQKKQFRIGQLSKSLEIEKFVIRFWEKEFNFDQKRSNGGQRFYQEKDFERFKLIKTLLYEKGFTIAGAKKQLFNTIKIDKKSDLMIASEKTTLDSSKDLYQELESIKQRLFELKKLL